MKVHFFYFSWFFVLVTSKIITYNEVAGSPYTVSYDAQSFLINGQRSIFLAGEVHYTRSTPGMWDNILGKARQQNLNAIQTYVFWNAHEHVQGQLNFSAPDLGLFLKLAAKNDLFIVLRVGPYCDAEWNYGCYPPWIGQIAGIQPRTYNAPWLQLMENFVSNVMAFAEPYLAKNGGPIIMAQIENEYTGNDWAYLGWIAQLVNNYTSACPVWIMCQGQSVNGTISTCDDCSCVEFAPGHVKNFPNQPLMNTEDHGFNQRWGWAPAYRTVEDMAFGVAQWAAIGGTYHSYYMWHGGNNYARNAASGIATEYANDVLLYSDGTPHEPKYSHLSALHFLLAQYSDVLSGQLPPAATQLKIWDGSTWVLGDVYARLYANPLQLGFIISFTSTTSTVQIFPNATLEVPPNSVSLVAANYSTIWNSATYVNISQNFKLISISQKFVWSYWSEPLGSAQPCVNGSLPPLVYSTSPLEQLNVTNDDTIYLWYTANITFSAQVPSSKLSFTGRKANAYLFYVNGVLVQSSADYSHTAGDQAVTFTFNSTSMKGEITLQILSVSLGIDSAGEIEHKGIVSNVVLNGAVVENWSHQKGTCGEYFRIYAEGAGAVTWNSSWSESIGQSATWYTSEFTLSDVSQFVNNPLFLNVSGLTRGHAYVNGNDIGLYWTLPGLCDYAPPSWGCQQGLQTDMCGQPTQILYHIPPDWLQIGSNVLTIFEDTGIITLDSVNLVQKVVTVA